MCTRKADVICGDRWLILATRIDANGLPPKDETPDALTLESSHCLSRYSISGQASL